MLENKPSLSYRIRKYLFDQKYTKKEKLLLYMAMIMWGAGSGVAGPVIIENIMGKSMDQDYQSLAEALPFLFYMCVYTAVFYPIFYYVSKFIVESFLFVVRLIKR